MRRYRSTGVLPEDLRVSVEQFRADVISDQGGIEDMTAIRAGHVRLLVDAEVGRRLLMNEVIKHGLNSGPGRAAYDRLLSTMATWQRIASAIGMERRTKPAMSLTQYLSGRSTTAGRTTAGGEAREPIDVERVAPGGGRG
jgi:hypothetical protein